MRFLIPLDLPSQVFLMGIGVAEKASQNPRVEQDGFRARAPPLGELVYRQVNLLPRTAAQVGVAVDEPAGHPPAANPRIGNAAVGRIDFHLDVRPPNVAVPEILVPVIEIADGNAAIPADPPRRAMLRRQRQRHPQIVVQRNVSNRPVAAIGKVAFKYLTRRRTEPLMTKIRIRLKKPAHQKLMKFCKGPDGQSFGVMRRGQPSDRAGKASYCPPARG